MLWPNVRCVTTILTLRRLEHLSRAINFCFNMDPTFPTLACIEPSSNAPSKIINSEFRLMSISKKKLFAVYDATYRNGEWSYRTEDRMSRYRKYPGRIPLSTGYRYATFTWDTTTTISILILILKCKKFLLGILRTKSIIFPVISYGKKLREGRKY